MTVLITLTTAGTDSGSFDLYSNLDGFTTPFATNVSRSLLVAGYSSAVVPDYTTTIRVQSKGTCVNYVDIPCGITYYAKNLYKGDDCPGACNDFSIASRDFFNL